MKVTKEDTVDILDIDLLHELIHPDAKHKYQVGKEYFCRTTLNEPNVPDSTATINNLPKDAIIIKVDKFAPPKHIFKGSKHECKRADYIIIREKKRSILYIEMKRESAKSLEYIKQQLRGARCFMVYCKSIGHVFWGKSSFLYNYKESFVSISHTTLSKRPTSIQPITNPHDTPENPLRVANPKSLEYNFLIS